MGAQTDLLSQRTRDISASADRGGIWRKFLGGTQSDRPATYRLASPLTHLNQADPPCWFMAGEKDDPSTHADSFRQRAEKLGVPMGLTIVKNAPHGFLNQQPWFDEMVETADRFFSKQLKQEVDLAD